MQLNRVELKWAELNQINWFYLNKAELKNILSNFKLNRTEKNKTKHFESHWIWKQDTIESIVTEQI